MPKLPGIFPVEKDQFYYHTDHLGSSNIITDIAGSVYQHLEYFPYGETWIEEGGSYNGNTPPYKFTGKELDPETGLYYFGARYYDPVLSRWISADPALGKYLPDLNNPKLKEKKWRPEKDLPGHGGVFKPLNLNAFTYTHNNPIIFVDSEGNSTIYIEIERNLFTENSIIGTLTINFTVFGVTLEEPYKENVRFSSSIPIGTYFGRFKDSPKFGKTIEILVKGRKDILFHIGNEPGDTAGCVLIGTRQALNKPDYIELSTVAFKKFQEFIYGVKEIDKKLGEQLI